MAFVLKSVVYAASIGILTLNVIYFYNVFEIHGTDLQCPELTIRGNLGRLGNQMFVLATLYGLAKLNNRNIRLMPYNFKTLAPYFDLDLTQVDLRTFRVRDPWKIGHWLMPADHTIPPTSNMLGGNMYPTSFTFFHHVRSEVKRLFRFRPIFQEHANDVLKHVKAIRPWTQVFVCVHVRRGDYLRRSEGGWLRAADGREVDVNFFRKAVQYFRRKYQNTVFLAVSDDRRWTREKLSPLGILTLPGVESPGYDLAVLSSCNHTIMSYGSFGFWGSYLAAGEVVYFSDFVKPGSKMAEIFAYDKMYPKDWVGMSTTPGHFWDNYTNPYIENTKKKL